MADDEARERARRRLEERQARMRGETSSMHGTPGKPASPTRLHSGSPAQEKHGSEAVIALAGSAIDAARAIGPKRIAIVCAALVFIIAAVVGIRSCMAAGAAVPVPDDADQAPVEQQTQHDPIDEAKLEAVLGDELAGQLIQVAGNNDDAAWIAAHPDAYTVDGEAVQYKLLKLAAVEPEAAPFVRAFPDTYPADTAQPSGNPASGQVPRLYQWDSRWGATVYSSTTFAVTGCCPTALSMVYQGLVGKGDISPYDMGQRAREGGYEATFDGTDATFLVNEAASLGLSCEALAVDAGSVRAALENGAVLVCNVGPGDFTDNGHFFVITGIDSEGKLSINDPYSAERSSRTWDVNTVLGQTKALWAYRLA